MFNYFKIPIWNELALELEDCDKCKNAQLIPLQSKLFIFLQKEDNSSLYSFDLNAFKIREIFTLPEKVCFALTDHIDMLYFLSLGVINQFSDFRYSVYKLNISKINFKKL